MDMAIQLMGSVPAGFPSPASDYEEEGIDLNKWLIKKPSSMFFFRVDGESMINAHIPHGSVVIVDKAARPKNNSIVIAVVNGEFTIKFFVQNKRGTLLMPANPKFRPLMITEGMDFSIWGVVTAVVIETEKYGI